MKVLIIGGGGREHALAWKLSKEAEVHVAPGNPGIAAVAECYAVPTTDFDGLSLLAHALRPNLIVVGPEDPLIAGLADRLREEGFAVFGPGAEGARLEGSKAFSKNVMRRAGVPTARFENFTDPGAAKAFALHLFETGAGAVVKASGAALGKGVVVALDIEEAEEAIEAMLVERQFGDAGAELVVEERLIGREFSLLTLVSPNGILSLPVAQDYKRALDGDRGPNTGGMGTYSPLNWVTSDQVQDAERLVVEPIREAMGDYRGILFSGIMATEAGPRCLEYNVRFGDPETQSVMRRLGGGFLAALLAVARGEAPTPIEVLDNHAVTVVVASGGYPGQVQKGLPIKLGSVPDGGVLFHAGTSSGDQGLVTAGGRVFGASGVGATLQEARDLAYAVAGSVSFVGAFSRGDIAS